MAPLAAMRARDKRGVWSAPRAALHEAAEEVRKAMEFVDVEIANHKGAEVPGPRQKWFVLFVEFKISCLHFLTYLAAKVIPLGRLSQPAAARHTS